MKNLLFWLLLIPVLAATQTVQVPVTCADSVINFTVTIGQATINYTVIPKKTTTAPPVDTSNGYALVYSNSFSTANDIDPDGHEQMGLSFIDFVNYKDGPGSFHSRPDSKSSGVRGEVQLNEERLPVEGAIEYDVKYLYVVKNQCHSFQVHPNTEGGSAIIGLWHNNGNFFIVQKLPESVYQKGALMPIAVNKWYHMRLEYKFANNSSGYYRWFIDGALYYGLTGKTSDGSGQYPKLGFNGSFDGNVNEAKKSDIIYDNWRIYKKK